MEFYGSLNLYQIGGQEQCLFAPVSGFFKPEDEVEIILKSSTERKPEALCLRRASKDKTSSFLRGNRMLERVERTKEGLWISIPRWAWESIGCAVKFYISLDRANFSEDGMPREILLYPVPVPQELVLESRVKLAQPEPEIEVININRGKTDISAIVAKVPTDVASLSKDMLKEAFGEDFDTEVGVR